jgi:DNA-binding Lrp family transcriptional regulator
MKHSFINLTESERKFLKIVLDNPEIKDSDISKTIGVSKATVGRIGKKLRKNGLIQTPLMILDLDMLGVDFFAVVTFGWKSFNEEETTHKMEERILDDPRVVYFSRGDSSDGLTHMLMVGFRNMPEYHDWMKSYRSIYGESITKFKTFFIPAKKIIKQDYNELIKLILKEEYNDQKDIDENRYKNKIIKGETIAHKMMKHLEMSKFKGTKKDYYRYNYYPLKDYKELIKLILKEEYNDQKERS